MYDIHCHMIPGVDDGPPDTKEALEMVEASYNDGIRHIAMTSHLNHPLDFSGQDDYDGIFCHFKKLVKERYPDLSIYPGAEVYISRKMLSQMDKLDIRTINNTKYVLVEFSRNVKFHEMDMAVHELKLLGYRVIIAHIEQYHSVREKYDDIGQLKSDGAVIQCNAENFNRDSRYSKIIDQLMRRKLVDLVASDCHNMKDRVPGLGKTYMAVKRKYGSDLADKIFLDNPQSIIKDQALITRPDIKNEKKGGIGHRSLRMKFAAIAAVVVIAAAVFMSRGMIEDPNIEVAAETSDDMDIVADDEVEKDKTDNMEYSYASDNMDREEQIEQGAGLDTAEKRHEDSMTNEGEDNSPVEDAATDLSGSGGENSKDIVEKSHEEILVGGYVSYLEELETKYMKTCQEYYSMLKSAMDLEDESSRDEKIEDILDQLGKAETRSDNEVNKVLYDMQNDLEEYHYEVAVVQELREHYLDVKLEVSQEYKIQLEEYENNSI